MELDETDFVRCLGLSLGHTKHLMARIRDKVNSELTRSLQNKKGELELEGEGAGNLKTAAAAGGAHSGDDLRLRQNLDAELKAKFDAYGLGYRCEEICAQLEVTCVSDLWYVEREDVEELKLKLVPKEKLLEIIRSVTPQRPKAAAKDVESRREATDPQSPAVEDVTDR